MRLSTKLNADEVQLAFGALQELRFRAEEDDETPLSEEEEALRQRLEGILDQQRAETGMEELLRRLGSRKVRIRLALINLIAIGGLLFGVSPLFVVYCWLQFSFVVVAFQPFKSS